MMRRREFITLLGGAAVGWPLGARAQQALPVVGFLYSGSPAPMAPYLATFLRTLAEAGYVENKTVAIDYRFAQGRYETLPFWPPISYDDMPRLSLLRRIRMQRERRSRRAAAGYLSSLTSVTTRSNLVSSPASIGQAAMPQA
jgi:hypothetical protein